MITTEDRIEAMKLLDRVEKLYETLLHTLAQEARDASNILSVQLLTDVYRHTVGIYEGIQEAREGLESRVATELGLLAPIETDDEDED